MADSGGEPRSTKPLAYVLGVWPFMGREFFAEPGVIYPREVSGIIVANALGLVREGALAPREAEPLRVVDMCSGSGNLACVLALELAEAGIAHAKVFSADLMPQCTALAHRNVVKHGLEGKVECVTGDLFAPLADRELDERIDLVTCSPPFISTGRLAKDRAYLLEHEPREAFDAGPYGLAIHQRLFKEAAGFLRTGGWVVCELGEGQAKQVQTLVQRAKAYDEVRLANDDQGVPLAIAARKR